MKILRLHGYTHDIAGYKDEIDWVNRVNPDIDCWRYTWSRLSREKKFNTQVCSFTKERRFKHLERSNIEYLFFPVIFPRLCHSRIGGFSPGYFKYIMKEKWDYAIFHYIEGVFNWWLVESLRRKRLPYGICFMWNEKKNRFDFVKNFMKKRIIESTSFIITESYKQKVSLEKLYRLNNTPIYVIPPGIRTDIYNPLAEKAEQPFPRLLMVGRICSGKGIFEIVRCLKSVKKFFPLATLELIGREVDRRYSDKIRNYISNNDLLDSVIFSGYVDSLDLPEKYNNSNLMVFHSKGEGSPKVVMESMACGLPVVALKGTGGHEEVIEHNISGWLICPQEFVETVIKVLKDREGLKKAGMAGHERILRDYTFEKHYEEEKKFFEVLEKLKVGLR